MYWFTQLRALDMSNFRYVWIKELKGCHQSSLSLFVFFSSAFHCAGFILRWISLPVAKRATDSWADNSRVKIEYAKKISQDSPSLNQTLWRRGRWWKRQEPIINSSTKIGHRGCSPTEKMVARTQVISAFFSCSSALATFKGLLPPFIVTCLPNHKHAHAELCTPTSSQSLHFIISTCLYVHLPCWILSFVSTGQYIFHLGHSA